MHSVSQLWCKHFGCDRRKDNFFLQLQWKGLGLMYEITNFLSNLFWIPILLLFYPSSQQSRITEECSKNVNLTKRITKQGFQWFQIFYNTRDSGSMSHVTGRNDVLMQNHSVKKPETLVQYTWKKKRVYLSLPKHFQILCYNMWHYVLCS
jgi:hypothetical protein